MVNFLPTSMKWLLFTFITTLTSGYLTGISIFTLALFVSGFIFSIGYFYKEHLLIWLLLAKGTFELKVPLCLLNKDSSLILIPNSYIMLGLIKPKWLLKLSVNAEW